MSGKKFRAWSLERKCYVDVWEITFEDEGLPGVLSFEYNGLLYKEPAHNFIIEQYTGLKDKNGKEIYEGDIVNVIGIGIAQVIDSPSGAWMLYYKREPDEIENGFACVVPKNKPSGLWKTNTTSYIEVIGNIHDNPVPLEAKNVD